MNANAIDIILVEDNPDEAKLTIRALKKRNLANNLLHLWDGEEIIQYLQKEQHNNLPKLILLDLKMPKIDGLVVIQHLKSDAKFKSIPIVVLTSSKENKDIKKAYELGANAYIVKPVDFENFSQAVSELGIFWLIINQPPV
ncbi:MAG: response regulator [Cyclobacteriaceae bacterium]|nr:response regulator [Cyclobacteriaceae bacterium]